MSNLILAIDTSAGTSIALVKDGTVLSSRSTPDTMRHAEIIGSFINEVLTDAGVTSNDVTHVAAGMGPGPFTGLRVGIAAADAFAFGSGAILLPMNSHDAIALESGRLVLHKPASEILADPNMERLFLGGAHTTSAAAPV